MTHLLDYIYNIDGKNEIFYVKVNKNRQKINRINQQILKNKIKD